MGNRAYKTLRNLVLAGSVATSVGGCLSPAFMTYGAAITNPGNAHLARAHGFAVLGDETNRLLNRDDKRTVQKNNSRGFNDSIYNLIDPTGNARTIEKMKNSQRLSQTYRDMGYPETAEYFIRVEAHFRGELNSLIDPKGDASRKVKMENCRKLIRVYNERDPETAEYFIWKEKVLENDSYRIISYFWNVDREVKMENCRKLIRFHNERDPETAEYFRNQLEIMIQEDKTPEENLE